MKFITGNRKTRKQWYDNIFDTKKGFNFRNIKQHSDGTSHTWKYNNYVSDSDTTPQFQSENELEKILHSNRCNSEFQSVR